jgi:hypothetical protein
MSYLDHPGCSDIALLCRTLSDVLADDVLVEGETFATYDEYIKVDVKREISVLWLIF